MSYAVKSSDAELTAIFNSERYCLNEASEAVISLSLPKQKVLRKMSMDYSEKYNGLSFEDKIGFADIFLQRASRMFVSIWKEENGRISIYFDVLNQKGEVTQEVVKLFGDQPFSGEFQVAFLSHTEKYDKRFQQHSLEVLKDMYDVLYVKSCEVDNV